MKKLTRIIKFIILITFIISLYKIDNNVLLATSTSENLGIQCEDKDLITGQCKLDVYGVLGIRKNSSNSVGVFVQDIVLSATMFIGTIVTLAMIISGLLFVFAGADSSLKEKAQKGLINAIIGLLIVLSSYAIIRLVQFILKGN